MRAALRQVKRKLLQAGPDPIPEMPGDAAFIPMNGMMRDKGKATDSRTRVVTLHPGTAPKQGAALLAYMLKPFLLDDRSKVSASHTHFAESLLIADVLLKLGYEVDVIDFENDTFVPAKEYDILISARKHFQRYAELVGSRCLKIAHLDISHWLYNNTMALSRCHEAAGKRGVMLESYRRIEPNRAIEHADFATMLGNDCSMSTYAYAGKKIYPVPVPVYAEYPKPKKEIDAVRRNFLWFGSWGFVQKGLDLVLEAFAGMPDYNLKVCGDIDHEPGFKKAYYRELYEFANIETIGWVDVTSKKFLSIANDTLALIYPSCAEGQSGGVVTCMHAGIIPVVSRQSGVDLAPEYGRYLNNISVEEIRNSVRAVSELPSVELQGLTANAWAYTRQHHSRERYSRRFEEVLQETLAEQRKLREVALTSPANEAAFGIKDVAWNPMSAPHDLRL